MKLSSRKLERGSRVELQMTSMIDVVFLLLIFFMTTAAFVQTERNLDPAIEVKRKAAAQRDRDLEPTIIEVVPGAGGDFVYKMGGREFTSYEELADVVRSKRQLDLRGQIAGTGGWRRAEAFVRVSDGAPFRMAAAAIQACKSAGYVGVAYVPLQP
jgi:biopolymer transport protein ExbD